MSEIYFHFTFLLRRVQSRLPSGLRTSEWVGAGVRGPLEAPTGTLGSRETFRDSVTLGGRRVPL